MSKLSTSLIVVLVLAGCAEPSGSTAEETTVPATAATTNPAPTTTAAAEGDEVSATITIENFSFGEPIEVPVGSTVAVVNQDAATHTWTSDDGEFDSGNLASGERFSRTFEEPGEYGFFCEIHPGMTGRVTVAG